ncbi:hypothetical protein ILUMI_27247 [Ignelater luminosus]|uniref:DDE Tnp4 domain-containing protein n=1 Tax=Ignelater luminosus TaxID=2038154 RepID=A0A8K0FY53_IGNLU|nr:hypothetical protein ILUMI_27247 [Ignelater luminosus]
MFLGFMLSVHTFPNSSTNSSFTILGDEYGRSSSYANDVFRKSVPLIATYLKRLILWPSSDTIKSTLPLPFRARYRFGGRTSNAGIVENSDFLQKLPEHCAVMADRGFKHMEPLLITKHIERIIRLRKFQFLVPHAAIPPSFMDSINDIVIIVDALTNLETPIINQDQ